MCFHFWFWFFAFLVHISLGTAASTARLKIICNMLCYFKKLSKDNICKGRIIDDNKIFD